MGRKGQFRLAQSIFRFMLLDQTVALQWFVCLAALNRTHVFLKNVYRGNLFFVLEK
jgi:hypothetical protein